MLTPPLFADKLFRRFAALLFLILLGGAGPAQAQFWKTTPAFPNGPKQALIHTTDSTLLTTVGAGILASRNLGRSWQLALRSPRVFSLCTTRSGQVLAGGAGKVYRSADQGLSWDSVALATPYPVVEFIETPRGDLLAATGMLDFNQGFLGSGVFFSADNGLSWAARTNGLGAGLAVNHLAADRTGRLYLSVIDEDAWKLPGLFISDNNGQSWQHIDLRINGRGVISDDIVAYQFTGLTVTPQDTLLCSFEGAAGSVGVRFNLKKSIADVQAPTRWPLAYTSNTGMWWMSQPLHSIHFARNGDWYSSHAGTVTFGGSLVSHNRGRSWVLVQDGLHLNDFGLRSPLHYAETAAGNIFMVQENDSRVYWTGASVITAAKPRLSAELQLFPNPTTDVVQVANPTGSAMQSITLTDLSGRLIHYVRPAPAATSTPLSLAAEASGIYLITLTLADGRVLRQRVVKQ
jgi:hypothetical protein